MTLCCDQCKRRSTDADRVMLVPDGGSLCIRCMEKLARLIDSGAKGDWSPELRELLRIFAFMRRVM